MKSRHTTGPWSLRDHGDANHHFILRSNGHWLMVLKQNGEMSTLEQEANARLVAAVPDLLAALEKIFSEGCFEPESNIGHICCAAIAKAKGE